jgi:thioredoxin 1
MPNTKAETVPPGATRQAHVRPTNPSRGPNDDAERERTLDNPLQGEHGDSRPGGESESETGHEPSRQQVDQMKGPVLLEFGAESCPHCLALEPHLRSLLGQFPEVRRVCIEDGKGKPLGRSFQVKRWPTLVFLRDGEVVRQAVRPSPLEVCEGLQAIAAEGGQP